MQQASACHKNVQIVCYLLFESGARKSAHDAFSAIFAQLLHFVLVINEFSHVKCELGRRIVG